ncbi:unnamed protein product [Pedinophyceae sp. YPF-701]|nr:unnamed protein product [Pedinophyceae sp. YPF-701]
MCQLTSLGLKKVLKELAELDKKPIEGIKVFPNEENVADISVELQGPQGTPYEGGLFKMRLSIGPDYPDSAPKGWFTTRIFHPNVQPSSGEICVNVLKKDWKPDLGVRHVLLVIRCLLIEPNPDSALNEEAGKLLLEDFEEFSRRAKLMTQIHAKPKTVAAGDANGEGTGTATLAVAAAGGDGSVPSSPAHKKHAGAKRDAKKKAAKRL